MYILTQAGRLEGCEDNLYRVQATDLEDYYLNLGYTRCEYERRYQLKYQHKEYIVLCPEFRDENKHEEPIVIIPDFLIPRRPYPVYVYLYAIDLYSANLEKGQRWAAEVTRKLFGLESFAHTTLGRALKVFARKSEEVTKNLVGQAAESTTTGGEKIECANQKESAEVSDQQNNMQSKGISFPNVRLTEGLRILVAQYLGGRLLRTYLRQSVEAGRALARKWFKEYGRLLL